MAEILATAEQSPMFKIIPKYAGSYECSGAKTYVWSQQISGGESGAPELVDVDGYVDTTLSHQALFRQS